MMNDHLALLHELHNASPFDPAPSRERLTNHLAKRVEAVGATAFAEFAYLQRVAAKEFGADETAHFARVLRDARVSVKAPDLCPWTATIRMIASLPIAWQEPLSEQVARSKKGQAVLGRTIWSVDYAESVLSALNRWVAYCIAEGLPLQPTASALHRYALSLVQPASGRLPTSTGTASNYLQRILVGLAAATRGQFRSQACGFVAAEWRERARANGPTTKTGSQLVGARALYRFGFRMMSQAYSQPLRGIRAATIFRNGLILAVGVALPERARALSWLEFDQTLTLIDQTHIHVNLPGEALKYPEARKAQEGYDIIFENAGLAEALHAYRTMFRPLFDDGLHLFPSVRGKQGAITPKHLGKLTGNMTLREFGVRIPIHRFRDNVATEASEHLIGGAYAAKTLLRHVDEAITLRHYDHSEGLKSAEEFENFIERRRKVRAELIL